MQDHHLSKTVRFSRTLNLRLVTAMGASVTVGLGVYTLIFQVMRLSASDLAWQPFVVMMVLALPVLLTYAERASVIPGSGDVYDLVSRGEFLWPAFTSGWVLLGGYVSLIALLGWGTASFIETFLWLFFQQTLDVSWLAIGVILLVTLNNLLGMSIFWRTRATFIFLGIGFLLLLSIWALFVPNPVGQDVPVASRSDSLLYVGTLLISSLWGINFIAGLRDEVQRPTKTILPAMLIAVALGGGLGLLVSQDIGRSLETIRELSIPINNIPVGLVWDGVLAVLFVAFGLSFNLLALNRGLANCLGVLNALNRDGFLPEVPRITGRRGGSTLLFFLLILLSVLLLIFLPFLAIVGLASLTFLWTTVFVNIPDLFRSKLNLPRNRRPNLPFHPLIPGITAAIGIIVPFYLDGEIIGYGFVWLVLGLLYYLLYARKRGLAVHRKEVLFGDSDAGDKKVKGTYRVLVGLANPKTAPALIETGARFAHARGGELVVLQVITLGDQMPNYLKQLEGYEEWKELEELVKNVGVRDVPVVPLVRLASSPAEGIMSAIREEQVDMVLLGWGGERPSEDPRVDPVLSMVTRHASCEVVILRGSLPQTVKNVIVPSGGGPYAPTALRLGEDLIDGGDGSVALVQIVKGDLTAEREAELMTGLEFVRSSAEVQERIEPRLVESRDIKAGILSEARKTDLLMIGASKGGLPEKPYFGGLAVEVAQASSTPTMLVRGREVWRYPRLRLLVETVFASFPTLSAQRQVTVIQNLEKAAVPTFDFFILIILAAVIASMGLMQGSEAVIIGAMLVAPLMSPILAIAMGMVIADLRAVWTAAEATVKGVTLAIVVGAVMALISPINEPTLGILSRTKPNILDLIVALASGAAAGYAIARKEVAAALPGVAIAAALVPPLCVIGYGIGTSQLVVASGALLLFITNLVAIVFSAAIIFLALGFHPAKAYRGELLRGLEITAVLLILVLAVLGYTTVVTINQSNQEQLIKMLFRESVLGEASQVEDLEVVPDGDGFLVTAKIIVVGENQFTFEDISGLEQELSAAIGGPVIIRATVVQASFVELDMADLDRQLLIDQAFTEMIEDRAGKVIDLEIDAQDGFTLNAVVVLLDDSTFEEKDLEDIQEELNRLVGAPVTIRVIYLDGSQAEMEGIDLATPQP